MQASLIIPEKAAADSSGIPASSGYPEDEVSPRQEGRAVAGEDAPGREPAPPSALGLTRGFCRRPAVEAEIRALPTDDPRQLMRAALAAQFDETIVYAIRQLVRMADTAAANQLLEPLIARCAPVFGRIARDQFPHSADDRAELIQRASIQMWRAVFDVRPAQEFWEVFFKHMIRLACSDAAVAIRRQRQHERPLKTVLDTAGNSWGEIDGLAAPVPEPAMQYRRRLIEPLVDQLPPPFQQVVRLRLQGVPMTSRHPEVTTISQLMGVTDRTVRNYLRHGERQIREWLADPEG